MLFQKIACCLALASIALIGGMAYAQEEMELVSCSDFYTCSCTEVLEGGITVTYEGSAGIRLPCVTACTMICNCNGTIFDLGKCAR